MVSHQTGPAQPFYCSMFVIYTSTSCWCFALTITTKSFVTSIFVASSGIYFLYQRVRYLGSWVFKTTSSFAFFTGRAIFLKNEPNIHFMFQSFWGMSYQPITLFSPILLHIFGHFSSAVEIKLETCWIGLRFVFRCFCGEKTER